MRLDSAAARGSAADGVRACALERCTMGRKKLPAKVPASTAKAPGPAALWPVWAILAACVWIAFSPALANGFVDLDDRDWILQNHAFQGVGWDQIVYAF